MLAHDVRGRTVEPRHFAAHAAPRFIGAPKVGRQPGEARLDHHDFEPGIFHEHALGDEAQELPLERLRLRDVIFKLETAPADRRRRVAIHAAGMHADRHAVLFSRRIDRPVETLAQRNAAHHEKEHLHEALVVRETLDFRDREFGRLRRHEDRCAQPRLGVEPLLGHPIVDGAAQRGRHVLVGIHERSVQRVGDGESRAEGIERLRLQQREIGAGVAFFRLPIRPRRERRVWRIAGEILIRADDAA